MGIIYREARINDSVIKTGVFYFAKSNTRGNMYKRMVSAIVVAVLLITALASIKTQSQQTDFETG